MVTRTVLALVVTATLVAGLGAAQVGPATPQVVQCVPPSAVLIPSGVDERQQPPVAVVDTGIRPKRTRLFLDERFIGLAEDFDGWPDFLYLAPGSYRLRAELEGYAVALFELRSREGCLLEVAHKMARIPGTPKDPWWGSKARPYPFERIFEPRERVAPPAAAVADKGADLRLRPRLAGAGRAVPPGRGEALEGATGQLRLLIEPEEAAVSLNGQPWLKLGELQRLESHLSLPAGRQVLEISAPGYHSQTLPVTVTAHELVEVQLNLEPATVEH